MTRVEALARDLIYCYDLVVTPRAFLGDTPISWRAYHPQLGLSSGLVYVFDDWTIPLFGKHTKIRSSLPVQTNPSNTLNSFAYHASIQCKYIFRMTWHVDLIEYKSLDELDILLALAGKRRH